MIILCWHLALNQNDIVYFDYFSHSLYFSITMQSYYDINKPYILILLKLYIKLFLKLRKKTYLSS